MFWNAFLLAINAIGRNMTQSLLTTLGVIIGVAAVIIMVTLGTGATALVTSEIESLGGNQLLISPGQGRRPGGRSTSGKPFTFDDAEAIRQQTISAAAVASTASSSQVAVFGNENWSTTVTGIDSGYFLVNDWPIIEGRELLDGEFRSGVASCIVGETIRRELFGSLSPVGQRIRLGSVSCQVVGRLEEKGQSTFGTDQDDIVLIPLRTFQRRISGTEDVNVISVAVQDEVDTVRVSQDIENLLRERRRISAGEDDDFSVNDMKEVSSLLTGTTRILTMLLGAVAAVSLLVGGIGIMNIMLVSVTERTREIGIRLAIGAVARDVLLQFLVEAVVLSSVGGLIGVVIALIVSAWAAGLMGIPFIPSIGVVLLAFGFSAAVGVVFGYFPARRAASLNPIDALRHE